MNTLSITISATQDVTPDQLEHMRLTAAAQYGVPQSLIDKLIDRTLMEAEFIQLLQAVTHDATRCNCCGHTRGAHVDEKRPAPRPAPELMPTAANFTMEEAAKEIGTSRIRLFAWMRDTALITLRNAPSAAGLKRGLVTMGRGSKSVLVTPKGMDHIRRAAMPQQATLM